jgi:membrane protein required for colicin V production
MNALDYAIIAVIAIGALHGLRRGAIRMITTAVALLTAFYCASVYYAKAGEVASTQLSLGRSIGAVIGWIAVFMLIFIAIGIVGNAVVRVIDMVHLGFLDRLGGALLGAAIATMLAGVAVMLMAAVTPDYSPLIRDSQLARPLMAYSAKIDGFIPDEAKQTYQRNRDELKRYWDQNATKGAGVALFPNASSSPSGN